MDQHRYKVQIIPSALRQIEAIDEVLTTIGSENSFIIIDALDRILLGRGWDIAELSSENARAAVQRYAKLTHSRVLAQDNLPPRGCAAIGPAHSERVFLPRLAGL